MFFDRLRSPASVAVVTAVAAFAQTNAPAVEINLEGGSSEILDATHILLRDVWSPMGSGRALLGWDEQRNHFAVESYVITSQCPTVVDGSTLALWHFDEGTGDTFIDSGPDANDGTATNHLWEAGCAGYALAFDGATTRAVVPHGASLVDVDEEMTIEAWVEVTGYPSGGPFVPIVNKNTPGSNGTGYFFNIDHANHIYFNTGGVQVNAPDPLVVGESYAIAAVKDDDELRLYVDGYPVAVATGAGPVVFDGYQLEIGGSSSLDRGVSGLIIDEVRISSVARSMAGDPPGDGLAAYYPFDGNADDASGNGHHGTVSGATLTADRFGNVDAAYLFDGTDDSIDIGSVTSLATDDAKSVFAWVKVPAGVSGAGWLYLRSVIDDSPSGHWRNLFVWIDENEQSYSPACGLQQSGIQMRGSAFAPDTWHLIGMVWSPGEPISVYLDGGEVAVSDPVASWDTTAGHAYIGRQYQNPSGHYFEGAIDDVRIYDRALSGVEILTLYEQAQ